MDRLTHETRPDPSIDSGRRKQNAPHKLSDSYRQGISTLMEKLSGRIERKPLRIHLIGEEGQESAEQASGSLQALVNAVHIAESVVVDHDGAKLHRHSDVVIANTDYLIPVEENIQGILQHKLNSFPLHSRPEIVGKNALIREGDLTLATAYTDLLQQILEKASKRYGR